MNAKKAKEKYKKRVRSKPERTQQKIQGKTYIHATFNTTKWCRRGGRTVKNNNKSWRKIALIIILKDSTNKTTEKQTKRSPTGRTARAKHTTTKMPTRIENCFVNSKSKKNRKGVGKIAIGWVNFSWTKSRLHSHVGGPQRTQTTKHNVLPATTQRQHTNHRTFMCENFKKKTFFKTTQSPAKF